MNIFRTKYNRYVDENNIEVTHQQYVDYLNNDGVIEETDFNFPEDVEVPEILTRRQFKIALAFLGYQESNILQGIEQLPEPTRTIARISYSEAGTFERSNSELIFVAKTFLQLTDEQIDEIFIKGGEF